MELPTAMAAAVSQLEESLRDHDTMQPMWMTG
jgi:hypothetical protein